MGAEPMGPMVVGPTYRRPECCRPFGNSVRLRAFTICCGLHIMGVNKFGGKSVKDSEDPIWANTTTLDILICLRDSVTPSHLGSNRSSKILCPTHHPKIGCIFGALISCRSGLLYLEFEGFIYIVRGYVRDSGSGRLVRIDVATPGLEASQH